MTELETETLAPVVLLVDDHEMLATSMAYMLRSNGFDAHRLAVTDLASMRAEAERYTPGVVLLDLELGVGSGDEPIDGADLVAPLREQGWTVLVMTGTTDLDRVAAAIARGARNWILKNADFGELMHAASEAAAGRGELPQAERAAMISHHRESETRRNAAMARIRRLSTREREVLDRLADGALAATISQETYTSLGTVRTHIRSILTKLEVNSQLQAVAIAHQYRKQPPAIPTSRWRRTAR